MKNRKKIIESQKKKKKRRVAIRRFTDNICKYNESISMKRNQVIIKFHDFFN